MVYSDISALIKCLNKYYKDTDISNKEIIKCINTISFVIKHMYEELNNLCMYENKSEHEKFHVLNHSNKSYNIKKEK